MTATRCPSHLADLEGRQVRVALDDGSRIDDCQLVSFGRQNVATVWVFVDNADLFIPIDQVVDIQEV